MSQHVETPTKTFRAAGAIGKHILVKAGATVDVAALGEQPIGTTEDATFAANDPVAVRLLSAQGTIRCIASGAFSLGAVVYGRADGKIDDISTTSAIMIGTAFEEATAAGDVIEVLPHG